MMMSDVPPAPADISLRLDRAPRRPKLRPPTNAANPDATMKPPNPDNAPVPEATARDTTNGGLNAETSNKPRTAMKCRKSRSSCTNLYICTNQLWAPPERVPYCRSVALDTAPLGSRIPEYTVAAPTQRQAPAANN